ETPTGGPAVARGLRATAAAGRVRPPFESATSAHLNRYTVHAVERDPLPPPAGVERLHPQLRVSLPQPAADPQQVVPLPYETAVARRRQPALVVAAAGVGDQHHAAQLVDLDQQVQGSTGGRHLAAVWLVISQPGRPAGHDQAIVARQAQAFLDEPVA